MIRIVRTRTLAELREDVAEADAEALTQQGEAERWNGLYVEESERADAEAERAELLLVERDQALADLAELRERTAARPARIRPAADVDPVWGSVDQAARDNAAESARSAAARTVPTPEESRP